MSVQVSYKKQFLLGFFLLLILFAAFEVSSKLYMFFIYECDFMDSESVSYLDDETKRQMCNDYLQIINFRYPERHFAPNQSYETFNINDLGFRGDNFNVQKNPDTFRIFVVGGSTVFGWGSSSDAYTIPSYLEQEFIKTNLDVEVINAGLNGINSRQELLLIQNQLVNYSPDLIIVYNGWNDIRTPLAYHLGGETTKSSPSKFLDKLRIMTPYLTSLVSFYYLIYAPLVDAFSEKEEFHYYDETVIDQKVVLWKDRMVEICTLGNNNFFETYVILQPILGSGQRSPVGIDEKYHYDSWNIQQTLIDYEKYAKELSDLDIICDETYDLRGGLDGISEPLFLDYVHVNEIADDIISKKLFEIIMNNLSK